MGTRSWEPRGEVLSAARSGVGFFGTENSPGFGDLYFTLCPNAPKTDIPIVGDWLGQGVSTLGVYRSSNRSFYLSNNNRQFNADVQVSILDLADPPNRLDGVPIAGRLGRKRLDHDRPLRSYGQAFYLRNTNQPARIDMK